MRKLGREVDLEAASLVRSSEDLTTKPTRILIIDNSDIDALVLSKEIRSCSKNCSIHRADSLEKGINTLHERPEKYDALILDLSLSDHAQEEALSRIFELSINLPILVITSSEDPRIKAATLRRGAHIVIGKSHNFESQLSRAIFHLLEISRKTQSKSGVLRQLDRNKNVLFCPEFSLPLRATWSVTAYYDRNFEPQRFGLEPLLHVAKDYFARLRRITSRIIYLSVKIDPIELASYQRDPSSLVSLVEQFDLRPEWVNLLITVADHPSKEFIEACQRACFVLTAVAPADLASLVETGPAFYRDFHRLQLPRTLWTSLMKDEEKLIRFRQFIQRPIVSIKNLAAADVQTKEELHFLQTINVCCVEGSHATDIFLQLPSDVRQRPPSSNLMYKEKVLQKTF